MWSIRRSTVWIGAATTVSCPLDFLLGPDDSLLGIAVYANGGIARTENNSDDQKNDVSHGFFLAWSWRIATGNYRLIDDQVGPACARFQGEQKPIE